ncbi:PREDICTED: CCR4-NOT transcription complex subunit 10-like [Camelina sativa]|uniref:CCR4-NOT transcription complex subunit 10-like n=1 Tax=Camelina sativa TaxID=90675 RepID=A0ABM1R755_CAMSA|nr:PREDICTED: CCR4-NOT transcription complex subunit 10-like [Camelina sativa]
MVARNQRNCWQSFTLSRYCVALYSLKSVNLQKLSIYFITNLLLHFFFFLSSMTMGDDLKLEFLLSSSLFLFFFFFFCLSSISSTEDQAEAANPGTNVYLSKYHQFDTTVTILNIAVTWFHLHQYTKSLSILESLFQNMEPLDDTIALRICFLLLDIALACRDAVKFLYAFGYIDKVYGFGSQEENGSTVQLSSTQVSSEENLGYDNVIAEIEVERRMKLLAKKILPTLGERSFSTVDPKLELQLYKVRFLLLTRNLRLAKREVEHAMNIAQIRDSSMALLLKSQLEYAHGNHQKVLELLGVSEEADTSGIFKNNLGCIYYQLGKYHASAALFSKALRNCSSLRKVKPFSLSQDKSLLITYNCGLLHLAWGKPLIAAQCFQKASPVFGRQPLLWLRLAECCIMALQKVLLEEGNTSFDRSKIRLHVAGKGKWRHLMMEETGYKELAGSTLWEKLSLPLARVYLSNGIYLLNESLSNDSKSDLESTLFVGMNLESTLFVGMNETHGEANTNSDSLSAFKDICRREKQLIKQALLANMAYVELELENPIKALSAATSLLQLQDCSNINVFLGHVYAAEALCLLNRPTEACTHLSGYLLLEQNDFKLPYAQEDFDLWRMHTSSDCDETLDLSTETALKPEEARGVLFANFAALLATQGDHDQAKLFVTRALNLLPNNVQATVTAVYIDLMLGGRSQDALARLKKCSHVSFVSQTS